MKLKSRIFMASMGTAGEVESYCPEGFPILVKYTQVYRVEGFCTIDEGIEMTKILEKAGFKANNQLEDLLEDLYENVAVVGDAIAPRKILTAVHEAYHAVRVM